MPYTERRPEGAVCNGLIKIINTSTKTQTMDNSMPLGKGALKRIFTCY